MSTPTARDLEVQFQPLRPRDLPLEVLLRVREHSKRLFGNQDRLEVAVAAARTALESVNATDLHRDVDLAVNRIRAQLLALEALGYLRRAGVDNGKRLFSHADDRHRFWAFVLGEYGDCVTPPQHGVDLDVVQAGAGARIKRERARAETQIRNDKDTGLRNLPFRDFEHNRVWLKLIAIAHDLLAWSRRLLLDGELARAEPKRLRYRLLHVAARLAFHARKATLRIDHRWPWATELVEAFTRARALPAPA